MVYTILHHFLHRLHGRSGHRQNVPELVQTTFCQWLSSGPFALHTGSQEPLP